MAMLEQETIERAVRWCADAGRQTTPAEVDLALGPLSWDLLLAVRALLAVPPPARPLGPHALADLSRGLPADVAAEREREGRYPRPGASPPGPVPAPLPSSRRPPASSTKARTRSRRSQVVVRKASTAVPAPAPAPPRLPLFEELLLPTGRTTLERLIRRHGGRRPQLVAAIASAHRCADGGRLGDTELDLALEHHGLDRAYTRRERDELLHAVRAAGGVLSLAATALGHDLASLGAAVDRLGLEAEVKRLREVRRRALRGRATLAERVVLVIGSPDHLADLELLEEFDRDLKRRLPEQLRALSRTGEPLELGLARSLSQPGAVVRTLLARLGVELRGPAEAATPPETTGAPEHRRSPPRAPAPRGSTRPAARPASARPGRPRSGRPVTAGARPTGRPPPSGRSFAPGRAGPRPAGRPPAGTRRPGARPAGPGRPRPGGGRGGPGR